MHLGESLTDVEHRWSGDRVSEVRGGEQQRSHFQVDQLKDTESHTVGESRSTGSYALLKNKVMILSFKGEVKKHSGYTLETNTYHVEGGEGSLTFGLDGLLHAVTGVFQDALHRLASSSWKHLAQVVQLTGLEETHHTAPQYQK